MFFVGFLLEREFITSSYSHYVVVYSKKATDFNTIKVVYGFSLFLLVEPIFVQKAVNIQQK